LLYRPNLRNIASLTNRIKAPEEKTLEMKAFNGGISVQKSETILCF